MIYIHSLQSPMTLVTVNYWPLFTTTKFWPWLIFVVSWHNQSILPLIFVTLVIIDHYLHYECWQMFWHSCHRNDRPWFSYSRPFLAFTMTNDCPFLTMINKQRMTMIDPKLLSLTSDHHGQWLICMYIYIIHNWPWWININHQLLQIMDHHSWSQTLSCKICWLRPCRSTQQHEQQPLE